MKNIWNKAQLVFLIWEKWQGEKWARENRGIERRWGGNERAEDEQYVALNLFLQVASKKKLVDDKQKSGVPKNRQRTYGIISRKEVVAKLQAQELPVNGKKVSKRWGMIS